MNNKDEKPLNLINIREKYYSKSPKLLIYKVLDLDRFSNNIFHLDISYNNIETIPLLPNKLQYFDCSFNNFKSLPDLPDTLKILKCSNNQLEYLPENLPILNELDCTFNKLKDLPVSILNCEFKLDYIKRYIFYYHHNRILNDMLNMYFMSDDDYITEQYDYIRSKKIIYNIHNITKESILKLSGCVSFELYLIFKKYFLKKKIRQIENKYIKYKSKNL